MSEATHTMSETTHTPTPWAMKTLEYHLRDWTSTRHIIEGEQDPEFPPTPEHQRMMEAAESVISKTEGV